MKAKQCIAAMVTAGCVLGVAPAVASAAEPQQAASGNWAGYVVNDSNGKTFKSVSASWTQPTANCTSAGQYAAFWVGLGGSGQGSQKLEQAGTEAECSGDASPTYFAWYELVPSAPVTLGLPVKPGDHIYTRVVVNGSRVTISLSNQTTGQSTTKNLSITDPDTSSAEWIAEAPSQCQQGVSNCQELPLADFGTVNFNNAYATDTGGHTGSVSDSQWSPVAVTLNGGDDFAGLRRLGVRIRKRLSGRDALEPVEHRRVVLGLVRGRRVVGRNQWLRRLRRRLPRRLRGWQRLRRWRLRLRRWRLRLRLRRWLWRWRLQRRRWGLLLQRRRLGNPERGYPASRLLTLVRGRSPEAARPGLR